MFGLSIISIIIIVVFFLLFWKLTKIIWKAILFTVIVIIIFIGLTGYLVYIDIQHMVKEEKIVIITSNGQAVTGAIIPEHINQTTYLTSSDLELINQNLKDGDYDSILGNNYLLITLDTDILDYKNNTIEINGGEYKTEEAIDILLANTTQDFIILASNISENISITSSITENEMIQYKAQIAGAIIEDTLENKPSAEDLINDIDFYPNRITLVLITNAPGLINNLLQNQDG